MPASTSNNVPLAFLISALAGLATTIGGVLPLFHKFKKSDKRILSAALSFSAGVMAFVSFCEILQVKALDAFQSYYQCDTCKRVYLKSIASAYSTFFSGILLSAFLDYLVHFLVSRGKILNNNFDEIIENEDQIIEIEGDINKASKVECVVSHPEKEVVNSRDIDTTDQKTQQTQKWDLLKMALMSAIALAIHNFPEGIATFVSTLEDTKSGIVLSIAIAIHNIPEGATIAFPVYYATGNAWKGFLWATISGIIEPIGGIFAYFIFVNHDTFLFYGIVFGLVSGIMIYIVFGELFPTSYKYSKDSRLITITFFAGMLVMATSLVALA